MKALMLRPDFVKALAANIGPVKTVDDDARYYARVYEEIASRTLAR